MNMNSANTTEAKIFFPSSLLHPPLKENVDMMVFCSLHERFTNMNYNGMGFFDINDSKLTKEELNKCICCQGRNRDVNYLDRINKAQEIFETINKYPKDKWLRVGYDKGSRNSLNEKFPWVKIELFSKLNEDNKLCTVFISTDEDDYEY